MLDAAKKVLFVGAHTDDEMIAAGTLRRLVKSGAEVFMRAFSSARIDGKSAEESYEILACEYADAMRVLGVPERNWQILGYETRTLPERCPEIRQELYDLVAAMRFDVAFIPSPEDDHQDHAVVGREAERVMKGRVGSIIRYQYPWNLSPLEANLFVALSPDEIAAKTALIRAYRSQHYRYRYMELFLAAARLAGLSVKREYAEQFKIIRAVV